MADHLGWDETVTLMLYDGDRIVPGQSITVPLKEAIRAVVEDRRDASLLDVFIATSSGSIEGLEAVRAIYAREDFPRRKV